MILRDATDADCDAIATIYNHAVRHGTAVFTDETTDAADRAAWMAGRRAAGFPVLVAEAGGEVAGFGSYGAFRGYPGNRLSVEHSVYVAPSVRRQGVGRALLKALIEQAEAAGMHVMVGGIDAENEASLALHEALGFSETGRMPEVAMKFGRWLTLVFMQRRLDDRAVPGEAR